MEGARDELHRLTLNLLENALRHTDPGTAVEATVERGNGEVVLAVEDDGPGIRRSCARRCSSASSAARATAAARAGSACRSCAPWRLARGTVSLESRWTAAAPASSCASRRG